MGQIIVNTDGGARGNPGPAAAAFVVVDNGQILHQEGKYLGRATNNLAEYQAVNLAFDWLVKNAKRLSLTVIDFFLDSQLVVRQLTGHYKIKSQNILAVAGEIKAKEKLLGKKIFYHYVPREENHLADSLVNQTLDASFT